MQLHNRIDKKVLREQLQQSAEERTTISFYQYANIENPKQFRDDLYKSLIEIGVFGRIYVANEGINAQISVLTANFDQLKAHLDTIDFLKDIRLNIAVDDDGKSFYKLIIKVRHKIVADGLNDSTFDVTDKGTHVKAPEFNELASDPNTVIVDMASTPTKTGYIQCRVINEEVTNVSPCDASISTGSIGDQQVDTGDDINFRAPFDYVEGDVLEISSTIGGGLNRNVLIDTATVNGILDLEIMFDISFDGIEDNLYTFECVDEFGTAMDCNIIWYDRFENVIFDGKLSELSDPNSPWPDGKIYIESPEDGFGEAWLPVGGYYFSSESASVNTVTKVIKFVLISIPV